MISASWLLLFVGATGLGFAFNAVRPRYAPATLAAASFFVGWLTAELALHLMLLQAAIVALLAWNGALAAWPGKLGAAMALAALALLAWSVRESLSVGDVVAAALETLEASDDDTEPAPLPLGPLLLPFPVRHAAVEKLRGRVYHEAGGLRLELDVFRQRGADHSPSARRPMLVYVHGGGWVMGKREYQGLPMLHHFAALGWVCCTIDYRLSPRATFPDHIVDVKRAVAWVRAHALELGGDPGFILVAGNSAGAHLAALAALTPNDRALQPGFEDADTSVAGCLSFYGIYDFGDCNGHWPNRGLQMLLERYVMKTRLADAPERFAAASPLAHVGPHAPPFLVVHGARDSLVPVAEARAFVSTLRAKSSSACVYIEVPGAQHAFEVFPSLRTWNLLPGLERFATHLHRQYRARTNEALCSN